MCDSLKAPTIDLAGKGGVAAMAKVERNDPLLEGLLLKDPPASSMRQPADNIMKLRVGEDHVELNEVERQIRGRPGEKRAARRCHQAVSRLP